ncbi:DUF423 domain-containing protein [Roseibium sp. Sym1]|uniref:DUF423 domain-containing protein n=1 Tax=Roseibium sp. Sym1 TaxID=3016006 RepID=UPI0022B51206|nr:DUF423 domain-containing protein [Roseibium sp. Sym1]
MTDSTKFKTGEPTAALLRTGLVLAGLCGGMGVASLALSAHANASPLLQTAAQMLLFHAPVFLGMGLLAQIRRVVLLPVALLALAAGLCLFCGDLFLRAFAEQRLFAMSAPTGGALVILSWLLLAIGALRVRPK